MKSQDSKSEQFLRLLRAIAYPNVGSFTASKFDYLFTIKETRHFFDWLLTEVTDECHLTREQLAEFQLRAAKGQVIWDLSRLEDLNSMMDEQQQHHEDDENHGDTVEQKIEALRKDVEQKEAQLKLLTAQQEFSKFSTRSLTEQLAQSKQRQQACAVTAHRLAEKEALLKSSVKQMNQQLSRLFTEFQIKFGDEDKLAQIVCPGGGHDELMMSSSPAESLSSGTGEPSAYENYLSLERSVANKIRSLSFIEIDCVGFKNEMSRMKLNEFNSLDMNEFEQRNAAGRPLNQRKKSLFEWLSNEITDNHKTEDIEKILKLIAKK
jgi:CYTH domain-containing protein